MHLARLPLRVCRVALTCSLLSRTARIATAAGSSRGTGAARDNWHEQGARACAAGAGAALSPSTSQSERAPAAAGSSVAEESMPQDAAAEIRCALDFGSGATKMTAARVDAGGAVAVASDIREILVRQDVARRGDNTIGPDVLAQVRATAQEMVSRARQAGATRFAAVATAVYRTSVNGEAFIQDLSRELDIKILLIDQALEGAIGYYTAAALAPPLPRQPGSTCTSSPLLAWDSGGGSFQLTIETPGERGRFSVYEGPCRASTVFAWLLEVQGRDLARHDSANPASCEHLSHLEQRIADALPPPPSWLQGLPADARVVTFGGESSAFRAAALATGSSQFSAEQVDAAIRDLVGRDDSAFEALGFVQPAQVLAKLTLVRTVLRRLLVGRSAAYYPANGSTQGMLLYADLWLNVTGAPQ